MGARKVTTIICIADTHNKYDGLEIPDGDILIHAGDMTMEGTEPEIREFARFFEALPHKHKVLIAGNHDFLFENEPKRAEKLLPPCHYLLDSEVEIDGIRIWGSPWQPWFHDWAFNLERGRPIKRKWDLIPEGIDVLVTHGPPLEHGDHVVRGEDVGCADLLDAVTRVKPRYHVFGHIHEGYGVDRDKDTVFVNASICDFHYNPRNHPVPLRFRR